MIKPFQIIWELIEFGLQALFLYVLAIILCVGMIAYVIVDNKEKTRQKPIHKLVEVKETLKEESKQKFPDIYKKAEKECTRLSGCRVLEDGTIEW